MFSDRFSLGYHSNGTGASITNNTFLLYIKECSGPFDVVSLVGTISTSGCHIHISLADSEGHMIGSHLVDNDIIFTTAEVSLIVLDVA